MESTIKRRAYCYLCGDDKPVTREEIRIDNKVEQHVVCSQCSQWANGHALRHILLDKRLTLVRECDYPGCQERESIECHMLGCMHIVCETHGNCAYEVSPDESVLICWYCCGKGWGD